jgi:hypothetical protein
MTQYIENASVNIWIRDPRNREVIFRILGTTKKIPLSQPYDGMDLVVDGLNLGKYTGVHRVNTELGTEKLSGGFIGYTDLLPELLRPGLTEKEVEKVYKQMYGRVLKDIVVEKIQHMNPDFIPDFFD